jgi:chromate transporter
MELMEDIDPEEARAIVDPAIFTDIYGLGQLAPGPNMNMVDVIGYHVAGIPGAILALLAFYLPSCTLVFAVGKIWDHFEGSPWRDAVKRGMAPIMIALMLSGVRDRPYGDD